jgi:hypothetical protein
VCVGQIEVFDGGLKLFLVVLGNLAPEDSGDLVGLADGAVGVQESLVIPLRFTKEGNCLLKSPTPWAWLRSQIPCLDNRL